METGSGSELGVRSAGGARPARVVLAVLVFGTLMFLLVLQFGCPLVTYGTPPEAECGQRDMGQLLVELSESFSEGFSADDARRAGARISQLPNKKGHVFRYGPVTFRGERYDDLSFYIHKRSGDHLWLSLYCHESPSLRPLVEEEIRILAGRLCR